MRISRSMRLVSLLAIVALVLGGLALSRHPRAAATGLPGSLAHWWQADGTPDDAIGSDDGTLLNGVAYAPGLTGDDQAFSFDGSNQEVRFDDRGGNFGRQDFTFSFFVKTTATGERALWEKRLVCDANSFWGFRMSDGIVGAELMSDQLAHDYTPNFTATTSISDGQWHNVALVRQGRTASLYIDAVLEDTATTPRTVDIWNDAPLRAGMSRCVGVDGTQALDGELDELMIFTSALTQDEIQGVIDYLTRGAA